MSVFKTIAAMFSTKPARSVGNAQLYAIQDLVRRKGLKVPTFETIQELADVHECISDRVDLTELSPLYASAVREYQAALRTIVTINTSLLPPAPPRGSMPPPK